MGGGREGRGSDRMKVGEKRNSGSGGGGLDGVGWGGWVSACD